MHLREIPTNQTKIRLLCKHSYSENTPTVHRNVYLSFQIQKQSAKERETTTHVSMVRLQASILHSTVSINHHGLDWNLKKHHSRKKKKKINL